MAVENLLTDFRDTLGQSESVERGQPSGGLDFSYDLSRGLSDHLGVGDGFGLDAIKRSNTTQAPLAATVTALSPRT